jgi:hypothetical protein
MIFMYWNRLHMYMMNTPYPLLNTPPLLHMALYSQ